MVRELIHDPVFLSIKSEPASTEDATVAKDLLDTLIANSENCVGMAANMIGERKRIIAFWNENEKKPTYTVMFNPEIIEKSLCYQTEESCLSLLGGARPVKRYKKINVKYQTVSMQTRIKTFTGFTAQIIQHETDHCNGLLI